jgi:hypothetical protein
VLGGPAGGGGGGGRGGGGGGGGGGAPGARRGKHCWPRSSSSGETSVDCDGPVGTVGRDEGWVVSEPLGVIRGIGSVRTLAYRSMIKNGLLSIQAGIYPSFCNGWTGQYSNQQDPFLHNKGGTHLRRLWKPDLRKQATPSEKTARAPNHTKSGRNTCTAVSEGEEEDEDDDVDDDVDAPPGGGAWCWYSYMHSSTSNTWRIITIIIIIITASATARPQDAHARR